MYRILFTCVLISSLLCVNGQSILNMRNSLTGARWVDHRIDPAESRVAGSPYYQEDWAKGKVYLLKHTIDFDSLHFNIHKNLLLFKQDGKILSMASEVKVVGFTIGDSRFTSFEDYVEYKDAFFKILSDGDKVKLLQLHVCKLVEGRETKGVVEAVPDSYKTFGSYYIYCSKGQFHKLSRKSKLAELFGDKMSEIKTFTKQNRIKHSKEVDLITLFIYIDQLYK